MERLAKLVTLSAEDVENSGNFKPDLGTITVTNSGEVRFGDGVNLYKKLPGFLPSELNPMQLTARQIVSKADSFAVESAVSSETPTITLGVSGASPTISGGVRISPARKSSSIIDVENDPHFLYVGAIPDRLLVSSTDMTYPEYLTGGVFAGGT